MKITVSNCKAQDLDGRDITQYVDFEWKGGQSKTVDWLFAYDNELDDFSIYLESKRNVTSTLTNYSDCDTWQTDYGNGTVIDFKENCTEYDVVHQQAYWKDVTSQFNHLGKNLIGNNWEIYKALDETMKTDKVYKTKWVFTPANRQAVGKWRIFGKLSADSISEAIINDRYIFMDPEWASLYQAWSSRQPLDINTSTPKTNIQVKLKINYSQNMKSDFSDLRFASNCSDDPVELYAWNETQTNGDNIIVWLNLSTLGTNHTYCMYYGNPSASATWDGSSTFVFFDDYEGWNIGEVHGQTVNGITYDCQDYGQTTEHQIAASSECYTGQCYWMPGDSRTSGCGSDSYSAGVVPIVPFGYYPNGYMQFHIASNITGNYEIDSGVYLFNDSTDGVPFIMDMRYYSGNPARQHTFGFGTDTEVWAGNWTAGDERWYRWNVTWNKTHIVRSCVKNITVGSDESCISDTIYRAVAAGEWPDSFTYRINDVTDEQTTSGIFLDNLFVANTSYPAPTYSFGEEETPTLPIISIINPQNMTNNTESTDLEWIVDKEISWCGYSLNGGSNVSLMEFNYSNENIYKPNNSSTAVATDGNFIWILDQKGGTQDVHKHNMDGSFTGEYFDLDDIGTSSPGGMTVNGSYILIVDITGKEVHRYWKNGTYSEFYFNLTAANGNPWGITNDGTNIWVTDTTDEKIYKYYANGTYTGTSISISSSSYSGITTDGDFFYITEGQGSPFIRRYEMDGTYTGNLYNITDSGISDALGITTSGDYFWVGQLGDRVYRYWSYQARNRTIGVPYGSNNITVWATSLAGGTARSDYVYFTTLWNITFNIYSGDDNSNLTTVNVDCNNSWSDTINSGDSFGFIAGSYSCTFDKTTYFDETVVFVANSDITVDVKMSRSGFLSIEEHDLIEWLYDCWYDGDCRETLNNIEQTVIIINQTVTEINETVNHVWDQFEQTDESVVLIEDTISSVVNATSNLTINYTLNVPEKQDYKFLPIRIFYWFLNETNTTCYNQAKDTGDAEDPFCKPLIAHTIGEINTNISFTVDLRPSLPEGNYTVVRRIDIDPDEIWINYGHEAIGHVEVKESNSNPSSGLRIVQTEISVSSPSQAASITGQAASGAASTGTNTIIVSVLAVSIAGLAGIIILAKKKSRHQGWIYSFEPR
jgi:hypothetical protein